MNSKNNRHEQVDETQRLAEDARRLDASFLRLFQGDGVVCDGLGNPLVAEGAALGSAWRKATTVSITVCRRSVKPMRQLWIFALYAVILIVLPAMAGQSQDARGLPEPIPSPSVERLQILVLKSFQYGQPVPDSIDRGLLAAVKEGGSSIADIFIEHLDLARTRSSEHRTILASLLRHKLTGKRIDIVIVEGAQAADFLMREGKDLFPNTVFLTLIMPGISPLSAGSRKVIDIPWRVDPAGTLRAALDLFPKTRRVVVVTGARDMVLPFLDETKKAFAPWHGKLDFEYTNEMTYAEMLLRVSSLPPDAIVIYSPFFHRHVRPILRAGRGRRQGQPGSCGSRFCNPGNLFGIRHRWWVVAENGDDRQRSRKDRA